MSTPEDEPGPSEDATESERRFLVSDASIVEGRSWKLITQAYLPAPPGNAVRVRLVQHLVEGADGEELWVGQTALLAIKGPRSEGRRWEEEFPLSEFKMAAKFVAAADHVIQKRRYAVVEGGATWEVDVFLGANSGLVIAELEGRGDWIWDVARPDWALREITFDERYNNEWLAQHPINGWALEWGREQPDLGDDGTDWLLG